MLRTFFGSLLIYCFWLNINCVGQSNPIQITEIGTPFIDIYPPEQYGAHSQNWDIIQDGDGLMYFANTSGLLIFDGYTWRKINNPNGNTVRSLCMCDGRIYVGMTGEVGYLEPNDQGLLGFVSIKNRLPEKDQNFKALFTAKCADGYVYFQSSYDLFIYNITKDEFTIEHNANGYLDLIEEDSSIYVWKSGDGLRAYDGSASKLVLSGEAIASSVLDMDKLDKEIYLLTTSKGFYIWNQREPSPSVWRMPELPSDISFVQTQIIDEKYIITATAKDGILVFDISGQLIQQYDNVDGLPSNAIRSIFIDRDKNLWAATNNGILLIHINAPFTLIDKRHGLVGSMIHAFDHQDRWYISGYSGLFSEKVDGLAIDNNISFEQYDLLNYSAWVFIDRDEDLLLGTKNGLLQVFDDRVESIYSGETIWSVLHSSDESFLIGGSTAGNFHVFKKVYGQWQYTGLLKGINNFNDFMEEESDGSIWMTDSGSGVFRFKVNEAKDSVVWLKSYGLEDGLPDTLGNRVYRHSSGLKFLTRQGIYTYDLEIDRFKRDETFWPLIGPDHAFRFVEVPGEGIMFVADSLGKGFLRKAEKGHYVLESSVFKKIENYESEYVWSPDSNHVMILGSKGLVHFNPTYSATPVGNFKTVIRSVHTTKPYDSLIYGGNQDYQPLLNYDFNAIRLEYTAIFYDEPNATRFQYKLIGFDDQWSEWSETREKEYTNLPHGDYIFQVRSKNIYGKLGEVDEFKFTIIAPWYLTPWAYLLYSIILIGIIALIVQLYNRKLKLENVRLESVIQQRTAEITRQKDAAIADKKIIEHQTRELQKLDRAKSHFFANISHELRTPITLIKAPIEQVINSENLPDEVLQKLEVAAINGDRLEALVEEILDLARLEAGKMPIHLNPVDLRVLLEEIVLRYKARANELGIHLVLNYQLTETEAQRLIDQNKVTKIIDNLLSNALKFSKENDRITITAASDDGDKLTITVEDTGDGIPKDDLPHIFDRFYQAAQPMGQASGGTGIGLALSQELAHLMGGSIQVTSALGHGSRFEFNFNPEKASTSTTSIGSIGEVDHYQVKEIEKVIQEYIVHFQIERPVLVIAEDHPEMRGFLKEVLSPWFNVIAFPDGKEALSFLQSNNVDIVISDMMMPQMDGLELLQRIKNDELLSRNSIVMLTARSADEDKLTALTIGVDDYITKPFNVAELLVRIKNILKNRMQKPEVSKTLHDLSADQQFIERLKQLVLTNLNSSILTVSFLADQCALSERQLQRKIKSISGLSPRDFIKEIKLHEARNRLVARKVSTVAEVAYAMGYNDPQNFSRHFADRFGSQPSELLK